MNPDTTPKYAPLAKGTKVVVTKGCKSRGVTKGAVAVIDTVEELGADYSHSVRVVLTFVNTFLSGRTLVMFARHANRLADHEIKLSNRPEQFIFVRRK